MRNKKNKRKENLNIKPSNNRRNTGGSTGGKPVSLVKDAKCQMVGGGPGVPSHEYVCRCKCYDDWRLQTWDQHWTNGGCTYDGSWFWWDWSSEQGLHGCCTYNSQEMGRTSCLSECEALCGTDSPNTIQHNRRPVSMSEKEFRYYQGPSTRTCNCQRIAWWSSFYHCVGSTCASPGASCFGNLHPCSERPPDPKERHPKHGPL